MLCNRRIDFSIIAENCCTSRAPSAYSLQSCCSCCCRRARSQRTRVYAVVDHGAAYNKVVLAAAWSLRMASIDVQTQG